MRGLGLMKLIFNELVTYSTKYNYSKTKSMVYGVSVKKRISTDKTIGF